MEDWCGPTRSAGAVDCVAPDATVSGSAPVNAGGAGSATVAASMGATYTSATNGASVTFTAGCTGSVTVTAIVTASCGASNTNSKDFGITAVGATVSGDTTIASGGSATLT